jgi:oligopeptide/dipeptide ABC transporter ATP-binding protein
MGQFTVANESTMRVGYLAMDAAGRSGEGPFTDIRVRKAVNHAINREENSVAGLFDAPRHLYTKALLKSVLTPEPGLGVPDTQLDMAYPNPIAPSAGCHFHPRCPRATKLCRNTTPRAVAIPQGHVACHLHDPQTVMYEQG